MLRERAGLFVVLVVELYGLRSARSTCMWQARTWRTYKACDDVDDGVQADQGAGGLGDRVFLTERGQDGQTQADVEVAEDNGSDCISQDYASAISSAGKRLRYIRPGMVVSLRSASTDAHTSTRSRWTLA